MAMLVVLLVSLPLFNSANVTTLDDILLQNVKVDVRGFMERTLNLYIHERRLRLEPNSSFVLPFTVELFDYMEAVEYHILTEFSRVLAAVPVQSICDDLNEHCSQDEDVGIEDLTQKPSNLSCVQNRLNKMMTSNFKMAVDAGLQQVSRDCAEKRLSLCAVASLACTEAHGGRIREILVGHIEDSNETDAQITQTHLSIILELLLRDLISLFQIHFDVAAVSESLTVLNIHSLVVKPFTIENIVRPLIISALRETQIKKENNTVSEDDLTWGIIRSNTGKFNLECPHLSEKHSRQSAEFYAMLSTCYYHILFQSNAELMVCAYADPESPPLKWLSVPPVYFHSQCLCLAYRGQGCRVTAPQGVDPRLYCLSVLLRDFQRRVSYRPAITYLDYAFQTRVPLCIFSNLMQVAFRTYCNNPELLSVFQSVQCYFKDLVDQQLNCSEALVVDTLNHTRLCNLLLFTQHVLCDEEADDDVRVPFYGAGDSTLVLLLTYVDVAVRVLTLVTYLVCSELRNLPGKLLICYQVTALLRLLVVRASIEDLQVAVRVDVAMDLASTLWLTSYLHFLTACIKALRLPDSLRPDEVRMVLLRYALLGWALPAALSAGFFRMDEVVDSRVQFGQVLFVLCNYAALLGNLYMFYHNGHIYYDVKSSARLLQRGGKARSVFALMFKFALKTSVLSGAGIVFRLVFTQIQGLEHVLGYYHALGTLQGLLLFALYGCSRQARVFWVRVFRSTLSRCRRPRNTSDS